MQNIPLTETLITSLNAQEPWPDNVKLYQPYEVEQILLPDNASCLAVQAFLKMCNLPFEVEMRWNAEFMSPSGRVPFIKCGAFVVSELEPVVQFAANKGVSLCGKLSTEQKAEVKAFMSMITNVLVNAELYMSWVDEETFNTVTKVRNSSVYPWPLGWFQTRAKRNAVAKKLKALHWYEKTLDQVLAEVDKCCTALSLRLGDDDFFFGTPTPLDALVYGHIRAILSARGPKAALMIKPIPSLLLRHLLRMVNITGMKLTVRFKPFASNQIIMTSKGGQVTCEYSGPKKYDQYHALYEEYYDFIFDIARDIVDEACDMAHGVTAEVESHDFEVIPFPNDASEDNYAIFDKSNDFLDTIDENVILDNDTTIDSSSDCVLDAINDLDSDGMVNDKLLGADTNENLLENTASPDMTDFSPTELDALVFGHVFTMITTRLPRRGLAETVSGHQSLVALAKRVDERYFRRL